MADEDTTTIDDTGTDDAATDKDAADKPNDKDATTDATADKPTTTAHDDLAAWKREARKHETRAKADKKRADDLEARLKSYEDRDKSEHEKAVDEALAKGRQEAETKYQQELRKRDLEVAVTRLAASKGVKVGDGEDAKIVKFADPDIVQMWVERQLVEGVLSGDDLFDDGKVNQGALSAALAELATDKPFLLAGAVNGDSGRKPAGDADAGKGSRASRALEDMDPDEHLKAIQGRK